MNGQVTGAGFNIELRERYGNVVSDRWPVSIDPFPDELLSSWLHRLAIANGIAPRSFASVLGLGDGMWSSRLDLVLPRHVAVLLGHRTKMPHDTILKMTMTGGALAPLLLPLRENARRNRSTWMQYCPSCLAGDATPYFRRQWRIASRVSCFEHGRGLRDRCPACRSGIATFNQDELLPQHYCARCGFDLRAAPKASITGAARQLERSVADLCRLELATGSRTAKDLIARLLRAPVSAGISSAKTLTTLSTSARVRCFEQLAADPLDWLVGNSDAAIAYRRRAILVAGGHEPLIARFANFLEKHQGSPRPKRSPPAGADRSALFEAYLRVMCVEGVRAQQDHVEYRHQHHIDESDDKTCVIVDRKVNSADFADTARRPTVSGGAPDRLD